MKVAIFGAGTMGSGIAQVFAAKGHTALMYASSVASAQKHKDKLAASLAKRVAKGKMTQEAVDALLANILVEEKSACADADLIIECVKEDMATKKSCSASWTSCASPRPSSLPTPPLCLSPRWATASSTPSSACTSSIPFPA